MNELELHVYGKIAQALAHRAYEIADRDTPADVYARFPDAPRPIFEYSLAPLSCLLWSLGILRPLDQTAQGRAFHFAFDCSVRESDQVAERNWQNGPSFPRLLEIFICFFNEGDEDFSSLIYTPFGRNGRMTGVLDALAAIGYVEKTGGGYVWTDAEPVMRMLYGFKSLSDPEAFKPRQVRAKTASSCPDRRPIAARSSRTSSFRYAPAPSIFGRLPDVIRWALAATLFAIALLVLARVANVAFKLAQHW